MNETAPAATRKARRTLTGVVVSAKMARTIRVNVMREFQHPKYEKRVRRNATCVAHDEHGEAKVGDIVEIMETRKLSKTKNWRLVKVLKHIE